MSKVYFMTGAAGFVGSAFIRQAAAADPDAVFYCLLRRSTPAHDVEEKLQRALTKAGLKYCAARFRALEGDIEKPDLGLSSAMADRLAARVTIIVHAAANVNFLSPYDALRSTNVNGAAHVLAFAARCAARNPAFHRLAHIGTAYAAGRCEGVVHEKAYTDVSGFRNAYEQSKYEAENLIRAAMDVMPVTIFRPSIIIGAAQGPEGVIGAGQTIQPALKLLLSRDYRMAPAIPSCPIDLIPVDDVARAMATLIDDEKSAGETYHITSGGKYPYTVGDYLGIVNEEYAGLATPMRLVSEAAYQRHRASRLTRENPKLAALADLFDRAYKPYLTANPVFDDQAAAAGLSRMGAVLSDPAHAFRMILRRAAAHRKAA